MRHTRLAILVTLVALACQRPVGDDLRAEAGELVRRFVTADTLGHLDSAEALADWTQCEGVPSADFVEPTRHVRILTTNEGKDTVEVVVEYEILGTSYSGTRKATFKRSERADTLRIPVARESSGTAKIQCGRYHPNHPSVAIFDKEWGPYLDDSSRAHWKAATAVRPSTKP